jgi:hypothetical protein
MKYYSRTANGTNDGVIVPWIICVLLGDLHAVHAKQIQGNSREFNGHGCLEMCAQTLDGGNRFFTRIALGEDERSPTLGYRNLGRRDSFLVTGNYPALSFDKYGLRTRGRPLYDKTKLMPIFGHVCIRKQWLIGIFVCYEREKSLVSKIHENERR